MPKVLIVEDQFMIAEMAREILVAHGYEVCGVSCRVAEGVALARQHKPEFAVIDLQLLDGGPGSEIVAQLSDLSGLGVLYVTGNMPNVIVTAAGHGVLTKPYRDVDLIRGLEIVGDLVATGMASPPFPPNFKFLSSAFEVTTVLNKNPLTYPPISG